MAATSVGHFFSGARNFKFKCLTQPKQRKTMAARHNGNQTISTLFFFYSNEMQRSASFEYNFPCKKSGETRGRQICKSFVRLQKNWLAIFSSFAYDRLWPLAAVCGTKETSVHRQVASEKLWKRVKPAAVHRVVCTRKWLRERADAASVTLDDWPKRKERPLELVHFGRGPDAIDGRFRCNTRRPFIWASINTSRAVVFRFHSVSLQFLAGGVLMAFRFIQMTKPNLTQKKFLDLFVFFSDFFVFFDFFEFSNFFLILIFLDFSDFLKFFEFLSDFLKFFEFLSDFSDFWKFVKLFSFF